MDKPVRVLVCGSRDWTDRAAIYRELSKLPAGSVVLHGGADGADYLAGEVAEELGFDVVVYRANWITEGKSAGIKRNRRMLFDGCPDLVYAFHAKIRESSGTRDMVNLAAATDAVIRIFER